MNNTIWILRIFEKSSLPLQAYTPNLKGCYAYLGRDRVDEIWEKIVKLYGPSLKKESYRWETPEVFIYIDNYVNRDNSTPPQLYVIYHYDTQRQNSKG